MEVGILSMRYAKAIIEYAQEKGLEDRLYQEFLTLSHSFCEQPGLREALDNPVITTKEKLALVCTAADGDRKINLHSKYPTVSVDWERGISGVMHSTEGFHRRFL